MAKFSYTAIPNDVIIDLQVSGYFYHQIVNTLLLIGDTKSPEEFSKALKSIESNENIKDAFGASVHILSTLIFEIETKATAQHKTSTHEVDIDDKTGELIPAVDVK